MSKINQANKEVQKLVKQLKKAKSNFQAYIQKNDILDDAKKYADKQGKELKKILKSDANKVKAFIEKEKATLDQFSKQLPNEVEKLKKFILSQRTELEKALNTIKKNATGKATVLKTKTAKKSSKKKSSAKAATVKEPIVTTAAPVATSESAPQA